MTEKGTTMTERVIGMLPGSYRKEVTRAVNGIRNRLPPVVLEHRIDALERHVDRRFEGIEAKLDEIVARLRSRAA